VSELTIDPRHTAVVVIDIQMGIVTFAGAVPHTIQSVVSNCSKLTAAARKAGAHVVLVHVGGSPDGADLLRPASDNPMRMNVALPPDWSDLAPELGKSPNDTVILKRQWGAFYGTDLDLQLRRRGLTTIILCGIATEFGVESTATKASDAAFGGDEKGSRPPAKGSKQRAHRKSLEGVSGANTGP
jgi:nicotinamidase-related amidase